MASAPRPKTYRNYINGQWVASQSGQTFENVNPATGALIGRFPQSDASDIDAAVCAAREAYRSWSLFPAPKRGELLYEFGHRLMQNKEAFARDMTCEMGKVLKEARGDVQEAIDMTFLIAGEGRRLYGMTTPSEMLDKFAMSVRMPLGVVGMITPWNFPLAIPSWKMIPALIAGNTVVWKPAEDTPLCAYNFVNLLAEVGIPPGVVNVVFGDGPSAGAPLVEHPGVNMLSFTGSTEIGKRVAEVGGRLNKRVSLEMGGKNPIIVLDDADIELAVDGALWGAFGTSGQRCTAASRFLVQEGVYHKFLDLFVDRARKLTVGDGLNEQIDVGPVINADAKTKIMQYIEIGQKEGAKLLTGGHALESGSHKQGHFIEPTIFADVDRKMRIACEEIFGPVASVVPVKTFEEAIEIANETEYGLSSSIYTRDVNKAFTAMRDLYTGIVYINAPTIGAETHLPFGGTKGTGNGHREGGPMAVIDAFTEWKAIYVDYSGHLQKAQIDEVKIGRGTEDGRQQTAVKRAKTARK
jgi:acyl-CoA reductase-like NAD-dependent aldehyde dehydrogenase